MKKNLIIICNLVCLIGFLSVMLGCDQPANEPVKPKIVRKKIRQNTDKKAAPTARKTASTSQRAPKSEPVRPGQKSSQAPVLAQKTEPAAVKPATPKRPKPSLSPKSDISDVQAPAAGQAVSKSAGAATNPTAVAAISSTSRLPYNPKGKVDPFEPLFREKPTVAMAKKKRKRRVPRTPLERIDLSQLRLVGIILAGSGNKALVEESNGKGYVIRKGTFIGTNAGKVVQIQPDKVIVAEEYEDVVGNVTLRNKELTLPRPPGEF